MTDRDVHAPVAVRSLIVGLLLAGGAVVAGGAFASLGGRVGAGAALVVAAVALALAIRAWGVAVEIDAEELLVRNAVRRTRFAAADVAEVRAGRWAGLVGAKGSQVAIVDVNGKQVKATASLAVPGSAHDRAELFLALRRWSAAHDVEDLLPHREYGDRRTRRDLLEGDEQVEVQAWLRRTDSRGWGGWEVGTLSLPPSAAGRAARWAGDEPPSPPPLGTQNRTRPVQLKDAERLAVRRARFREEEFFGPDTSFLVITTLRRTVEVGLQPDEADRVLGRLRAIDDIPEPITEEAG